MVIEMPKRKIVYIGNMPPEGDCKYKAWVDTTTREIKIFDNGEWVMAADMAE